MLKKITLPQTMHHSLNKTKRRVIQWAHSPSLSRGACHRSQVRRRQDICLATQLESAAREGQIQPTPSDQVSSGLVGRQGPVAPPNHLPARRVCILRVYGRSPSVTNLRERSRLLYARVQQSDATNRLSLVNLNSIGQRELSKQPIQEWIYGHLPARLWPNWPLYAVVFER